MLKTYCAEKISENDIALAFKKYGSDARGGRTHLRLRAMVNQLPNEFLALFERTAKNEFGVSGKKKCFASVGGCLYQTVVGWRFCSQLMRERVSKDLGGAEFTGVPETKRAMKP